MALAHGKRACFNCEACAESGGARRKVRAYTSSNGVCKVTVSEAERLNAEGKPLPGMESARNMGNGDRGFGSVDEVEGARPARHTSVKRRRTSGAVHSHCDNTTRTGWNPHGIKGRRSCKKETDDNSAMMGALESLAMLAAAGTQLERLSGSEAKDEEDSKPNTPAKSSRNHLVFNSMNLHHEGNTERAGSSHSTEDNSTTEDHTTEELVQAGKILPVRKKEETEEEREEKRQRRIQANRESARNTIRRKKALQENLATCAQELESENASLRQQRDQLIFTWQMLQMDVGRMRQEHDRAFFKAGSPAKAPVMVSNPTPKVNEKQTTTNLPSMPNCPKTPNSHPPTQAALTSTSHSEPLSGARMGPIGFAPAPFMYPPMWYLGGHPAAPMPHPSMFHPGVGPMPPRSIGAAGKLAGSVVQPVSTHNPAMVVGSGNSQLQMSSSQGPPAASLERQTHVSRPLARDARGSSKPATPSLLLPPCGMAQAQASHAPMLPVSMGMMPHMHQAHFMGMWGMPPYPYQDMARCGLFHASAPVNAPSA
eukprot:CAMPEP_0114228588 /NCGR_PEP_ID=MMETSP0058-20121206/2429_1 /TAXON_ID=36894 /ORGANISM="Pyramimonas parkeae, CCMP726" /LENGTH=538 /DNA_ID=CAMNT_0001339557 /DNA_START=338 /DNA_END=1954 /DNA_ORIENTATION=+